MADQNIFNLGEHGVVLTPTPLHAKDGSFARAQNVEFFLDQGKGGIRQRPPLRRLSATQADAGYGVAPVPLDDPFSHTLWIQAGFGENWKVSTDNGTTWTDASGPTKPLYSHYDNVGQAGALFRPVMVLRIDRRNFYHYIDPADTFGDNGIGVADGVRGYPIGLGPTISGDSNLRMTNLCQLHGTIYSCRQVWDDYTYAIFGVDPATGELTQLLDLPYVGSDANSTRVSTGVEEEPIAMVSYLGRLWLFTHAGTSGVVGDRKNRVLSARLGDSAWVEERTLALGDRYYFNAAVYKGQLFLAMSSGSTASPAIIEKRTVDGTWSTTLTSSFGGGAVTHAFAGLIVYEGNLYAVEYRKGNASQTMTVHKFDGSAWSVDDTFACDTSVGNYGPFSGSFVIGPALYLNGRFGTRRKLAGAWSALTTGITSDSQFATTMVGS